MNPLLWGYSGLLVSWSKSQSLANCLYLEEANSGPLSDMTFFGIPNFANVLFVKLMTVSDVLSGNKCRSKTFKCNLQ